MSRKRAKPESSRAHEPVGCPEDYFDATPDLAVDYDTVAEPLHQLLHRYAGTKTREATKRWALDEARIRRVLFECSKASLAVLDAVVDHAGALPQLLMVRVLADQGFENAPRVAKQAADELVSLGLLIPYRWYGDEELYKTCVEVFETIAPLVHGVTVPPVPAVPHDVIVDRRGPRDALITLAALAHVPVRATNSGPHRSDTKKIAAALARDETWVERLLFSALESDAIVASNKLDAPRLDVLHAIATGRRHARDWWPDGLERNDEWFIAGAVRRALAADQRVAMLFEGPEDVSVALEAFELATVDGIELARRPQPSPDGTGDGHVTPSFEIFLGPAADLGVTRLVALAAEPTRLDAVATFKLTPKSIASAARLGVSIDEVLGALERVGPHGVPANVRATVLDWASSVGTAKVRTVFAVECSAVETADRAARALGTHVVQRPTPTLLLVDTDPHAKLVKAGVVLGADTLPPVRRRESYDPPLALLYARPDPKLRAHFAAAKARPPSALIARATTAEVVHGVLGDIPTFLRECTQGSPSPSVTFALRRLADLWEKQNPELEAWLLGHSDPKSALYSLIERPFALAPYLTLDPTIRAQLRQQSTEPHELMARAIALRPHLSGELGRLMKKPAVARFAANLILSPDAPPPTSSSPRAKARTEPSGHPREHDHAAAFLQAATEGRRVRIRLTSGRVVELMPQRVLPVGDDLALAGEDSKTGEARSVSARDVVSLETI